MSGYERFARFYDAAMDDPAPRAARVLEFIDRYQPGAETLLELGCGTGSILAQLTLDRRVDPVDRVWTSRRRCWPLARWKVPSAQLIEGDMSSFALGERFDVVICVFDSLNHLLTFAAWESMFAAVAEHLNDGGLFIVDANTVGELRRLGEEPPWVYEFDDNVLIMDVIARRGGPLVWDIRIFEHVGESQYLLHHEEIGELGVSSPASGPRCHEVRPVGGGERGRGSTDRRIGQGPLRPPPTALALIRNRP